MSRFGVMIILLTVALAAAAYRLRAALGEPLYGVLVVVLGITVLVGCLDWVAKKPADSKWKTKIPMLSKFPSVEQIPQIERLLVLVILLAVTGAYYVAVK